MPDAIQLGLPRYRGERYLLEYRGKNCGGMVRAYTSEVKVDGVKIEDLLNLIDWYEEKVHKLSSRLDTLESRVAV